MIKAVIFDCFGVIIADALEAIVADLRHTNPEVAQEVAAVINAANKGVISTETSRHRVSELLGIDEDTYVQKIRTGEVKDQAVLDYALELRAQYKTGMLSNMSNHGLNVRFAADELARYFDAVIVSGMIGYAKPEEQAYQAIADQLGVRLDECVMIDDRQDYCDGARSAGMQTVLYQSLPQLHADLPQILKR